MKSILLLSTAVALTTISCMKVNEENSSLLAGKIPEGTKIFASIVKENEGFRLYAATQETSEEIRFCFLTDQKECDIDTVRKMEVAFESPIQSVHYVDIKLDQSRAADILLINNQEVTAKQTIYLTKSNGADANIDLKLPGKDGSDSPKIGQERYDWTNDITFANTGTYSFSGNTYNSATYKDVMTHVRKPYLQDSPMTIVHESLHFLLHEHSKSGHKFIYHFGGKGAFWPEPPIKTSNMTQELSSEIKTKGKIYKTYVSSRPNQPIGENIVDEWTAYIVEAKSLVETVQSRTTMRNDGVEGAFMESAYYNAAAVHATLKVDPSFFNKPNAKAVLAMNFEKSAEIRNLQNSLNMRNQHTNFYYDYLKNSPAAEGIRSSMKTVFGAAWTMSVLGF